MVQSGKDWLRENDPKHAGGVTRRGKKNRRRVFESFDGLRHGDGPHDGRHPREIKAGKKLSSVKSFVEYHRGTQSHDCIFVPVAIQGRAAAVTFCGRKMSASRYACLLQHGAPKSDGLHARHLCGNGHLNCINPHHLVWGSPGDNIADANKHRALGDDATVQDKINAID